MADLLPLGGSSRSLQFAYGVGNLTSAPVILDQFLASSNHFVNLYLVAFQQSADDVIFKKYLIMLNFSN